MTHYQSTWLKLIELSMTMVLKSVEDVKRFLQFHSCKTNLIHLDLVVRMYAQSFYILKTFPFTTIINCETNKRTKAHMSSRHDNCRIVSYYIFLHPSFVAMGKVLLDNDSNQPKDFTYINFSLNRQTLRCPHWYFILQLIAIDFTFLYMWYLANLIVITILLSKVLYA